MKNFIAEHWSFNPGKRELKLASGRSISLPPQAVQLLELLCRHPGELLSSYRIIDEIWDGNLTVGEQGLRQIVLRLRREIPEDGSGEQAVINVPRKGYRLRDKITVSEISLPGRSRIYYATAVLFAVMSIILLSSLHYFSDDEISVPVLEVVNVTSQSGYEESPAVSPDNRYLLYTTNETGSFNLYLRDLQNPGQQDSLLVDSDRNLGGIAWNFDGSRFAYLTTTDNADIDDVYIYDMGTADSRQVAQQYVPTFSKAPFGLAWSPVENRLAYTSLTESNTKSAIFLHDDNRDEQWQLTEPDYIDMHPAWSPNGETLTFHRIVNPELGGMFAVDVADGEVTDITRDNIKIYGHVWLDQRHILYSGYENGFFYPFVINIQTHEKLKINIAGNFKYPAASASEIYYVRSSLERQIQRHSLSDENLVLEEIIDSASNQMDPLVHTPSGKLAFTSNRTGYRELWYRASDVAELQQITRAESVVNFPSFSASGRLLLYRQHNQQTTELELVVHDLERQQVFENPIISSFIGMFAGSDRYITYLQVGDETRELWAYDLSDHSRKKLADGVWAPIGADQQNNVVYFIKGGEIHRYDLNSDQTGAVEHQINFQPPFMVHASKLYFFRPQAGTGELVEFNFNTGDQYSRLVLSDVLYSKLSEFSFNPDSGEIYLNVISKSESDIYSFSRDRLRAAINQAFE